MRKLKVFYTAYGYHERFAACNNMEQFAKMTGVGRSYSQETKNPEKVSKAMAKPFTLFIKGRDESEWREEVQNG